MIAAAALPLSPPAIEQPAARQVSFGLVSGTVAPGTRSIVVRVGGRIVADRPLVGHRFSVHVALPPRETSVRVTSTGARGVRRSSVVAQVFGLPRAGEPHVRLPRLDPGLQSTIHDLAASFGGICGVYVQSLTTGAGAAWNARARFPAASTLKLAIAVAVLRVHDGVPPPGSRVDVLLRRMLVESDNRSANELEAWLGGSWRVDATIRDLGLRDTIMYGGYEVERRPASLEPIPVRVERQPYFGTGKYTTAWDLARLIRSVWLAAGARGPFPGALTPPDARYLLFLLAQVRDRGKLDRFLSGRAVVLH